MSNISIAYIVYGCPIKILFYLEWPIPKSDLLFHVMNRAVRTRIRQYIFPQLFCYLESNAAVDGWRKTISYFTPFIITTSTHIRHVSYSGTGTRNHGHCFVFQLTLWADDCRFGRTKTGGPNVAALNVQHLNDWRWCDLTNETNKQKQCKISEISGIEKKTA